MAGLCFLQDCQSWLEKGRESWNSYFSKWENYAKCEENIPEEELVYELQCKSREQVKKKLKQPLPKKKLKIGSQKKKKEKYIFKEKKNYLKAKTNAEAMKVLPIPSNNETSEEIIEDEQLETSLKQVFSDFLKADENSFGMFAALFQTFSYRKITVINCGSAFLEQQVLPHKCQLSLARNVPENQQHQLPALQASPNIRTICPNRYTYTPSLQEYSKDLNFKPTNENCMLWGIQSRNSSAKCGFGSKEVIPMYGNVTSPPSSRLHLEVKSCPPLHLNRLNIRVKSVQLDFSNQFKSSSCQKPNEMYLKNSSISKMNITREGERFENLCLRKRTNNISLNMENSNSITPKRNSSEQKCFNKIASQKRCLSKKFFFEIEEDDSESEDQTKYHSPIIHSKNKRLKLEKTKAVTESDSDDCESIFDRTVKG